jgi:hypothetical protein
MSNFSVSILYSGKNNSIRLTSEQNMSETDATRFTNFMNNCIFRNVPSKFSDNFEVQVVDNSLLFNNNTDTDTETDDDIPIQPMKRPMTSRSSRVQQKTSIKPVLRRSRRLAEKQ